MVLLAGEDKTRLACRDETEKRTVIDITKATIDFYENVKATTKTNITPMGDAKDGFDVYIETDPLKGPLFKTNVKVPYLHVTPTLEFKLRLHELANWFLLCTSTANGDGKAPVMP